jgi:hypothetical protein
MLGWGSVEFDRLKPQAKPQIRNAIAYRQFPSAVVLRVLLMPQWQIGNTLTVQNWRVMSFTVTPVFKRCERILDCQLK